MLSLFVQQGAESLDSLTADEEPVEKTLSIIDLLMSGGIAGQIIILVLFILLFVAIYIYFERLFAIKAASRMDSNFMNQIKDNVSHGNIEAAKVLCAPGEQSCITPYSERDFPYRQPAGRYKYRY